MPPVSVRKPKKRNFPTWRPHPKKPSSEPSWPSETVVLWREQSLRSLLKSPCGRKNSRRLRMSLSRWTTSQTHQKPTSPHAVANQLRHSTPPSPPKSPKSQKKLLQLQNPKQLQSQLLLQLQNQNQNQLLHQNLNPRLNLNRHQHQLPCSPVHRSQMMKKAKTPKRRSLKILIRRFY